MFPNFQVFSASKDMHFCNWRHHSRYKYAQHPIFDGKIDLKVSNALGSELYFQPSPIDKDSILHLIVAKLGHSPCMGT